MAIKPLKLKHRLTEAEAAMLLSSLIGEEVTIDDMAEYARTGIVPAYIEMDQEKYPNALFNLIEHREYLELDSRDVAGRLRPQVKKLPLVVSASTRFWHKVVPFPLLKSRSTDPEGSYEYSIAVDSNGVRWAVFAALQADDYCSGHGPLERVRDEHFVRVYTPQAINLVAQVLNNPTACPGNPAVIHTRTSTEEMGGYNGFDEDWPSPLISPYEVLTEQVEPTATPGSVDSSRFDPRERDSYKRILYVLAKKAGLKLEELGGDAKDLVEYAAREGLILPTGKGTIEKKLLAAKLMAQKDFSQD